MKRVSKTLILKKVARHHRLEDAGHEKWFLHDKKLMAKITNNDSANKDSVSWLYSNDCQLTRDAAYAIMSEIYKAEDERVNIALLLTLESSGHVFFEKVVNQVKKTGLDSNLKYFSSSHLEVELAHALFEEEMEKQLFAIKLPIAVRREALKMVDRCYEAFNHMFDGLVIACEERMKQSERASLGKANDTVEAVSDRAV